MLRRSATIRTIIISDDRAVAVTDGPAVERATETKLSGTVQGASVHVHASSDAPAGEPSLRFAWRVDRGAWSAFAPGADLDTPPLAPGLHEVEARARHAANAAGETVDAIRPARLTIVVDPSGSARLLP